MNILSRISGLMVFALIALVAISGTALALPSVEYVKVDGDKFEDDDTLVVEKGQSFDVKVKLQANTSQEDVEVEYDIIGYEYNDHNEISASTGTFDMSAGDTKYKEKELTLPLDAEKDYYDLRVRVASRRGPTEEHLYRINVDGERHQLNIKRINTHYDTAGGVEAGRILLVDVKVENYGEKDEDDVLVRASIPGLGIEDTFEISEIEEGESELAQDLYFRIPSCAEPGNYELKAEAEYDNGYETVTDYEDIEVLEGDLCEEETDEEDEDEGRTIVSVGSRTQEMTKGEGGATYVMAITNTGSESKVYELDVSGVSAWADYKVEPSSSIVVEGGQTKSVFLTVSATEESQKGAKSFVVNVNTDDKTQPVQFNANVKEGENQIQNWAEIVLIALIALLVILGLVIGFTRIKGKGRSSDEENDEELAGQTYY